MRNRVLAIGLLLVALVLVGCGGAESGRKQLPAVTATAEHQGGNLVVKVETTNFVIGKDGHVHIYINDGPEAMIFGDKYTVESIEPGEYKVRVELANHRHENIGIGTTVELQVKP